MVLSAKVKKTNKIVSLTTPYKGPNIKSKKRLKFKLSGPAVILLILLGFIFYSFGGQMAEVYNVQNEIKNIRLQMNELKTKNIDLKRRVDQLNSTAYIEREAREKLGLVKPGEKILLEARPSSTKSEPPTEPGKVGQSEIH